MTFHCTFAQNIEPLGVRDCLNTEDQRARDFGVDASVDDGVQNLVERGEASPLCVQGFKDDFALEPSAVLVVEVALGGIAKSGGTAEDSVGFDVGAGAEGHIKMLFEVQVLCQIELRAISTGRRGG
jgi:hypothetical protein